ncbi:hypothetical protein SAMN05421849_0980 [Pontibaca methylaminivorans]|uniref:Uncharacterized protein n=1 Tax=Pontibaca methylaminivorans TaxID=515897 RepID=A0A1R3WKB8_9RHOB|nr:hypothetical protein SAMN05421849_0980 [Pontibaca methylaminivorans]
MGILASASGKRRTYPLDLPDIHGGETHAMLGPTVRKIAYAGLVILLFGVTSGLMGV